MSATSTIAGTGRSAGRTAGKAVHALAQRGQPVARAVVSAGGRRVAKLGKRRVPRQVVLRAVPALIERRFDPVAAGDLVGTFELRITDPSGGEPTRYALVIEHGRCTVVRRPAPESGAQVTISAPDMIRLGSGAVEWPVLLGRRRLELTGNPFLALRFPQLFRFYVG